MTIDGLVVMNTCLRVSCDECLDWRIGMMNCQRKDGRFSSIYVRPVEGGEVSTVVGISYVNWQTASRCTQFTNQIKSRK